MSLDSRKKLKFLILEFDCESFETFEHEITKKNDIPMNTEKMAS